MRRALANCSPSQQNSRAGGGAGRTHGGGGGAGRVSGISKQHRPSAVGLLPKGVRPSSLSRRSSIVYTKGSQLRSDPRPINEKSYQIKCMRSLVDYLTTHGYSIAISPKLLPSGKEIRDMIEFLFSKVEPNFKLGKLEDDVPYFFRILGYPFQISKSALYAAGSPHSWPGLLAALTWLVALLLYMEKAREIEMQAESDDMWTRVFEYVSLSYRYYMEGDDESCAALDEQCRQQFEDEKTCLVEENEGVMRQIAEARAQLQALKTTPDPVAALENKKSDLISDIGKFNSIISNFTAHKQSLENKLQERNQELEAKEAEVARISQENETVREQVLAQQVNVEDVKRMLREIQRVGDELQSAATTRKEREQVAWDMEVQASKTLKNLDNQVIKCNDANTRLKLLHSEEAQSKLGNPFKLKLNSRGETDQEVLGVDIKGVIRPQLVALIEDHEKIARELRQESTVIRKQLHAKEDALQEIRSVNLDMEAKNKKLEAKYKKMKSDMGTFVNSSATECEALSADVEKKEEEVKMKLAEVDDQLKNVQAEKEQLAASCNAEIQREVSEFKAEIELYIDHKEFIQSIIAQVKTAVDITEETVNNTFIRKEKQLRDGLYSSLFE